MAYNRDLQVYNIVYSLHCFLFQLGQRLVDLIHYLQSPLQERKKMSQIFSITCEPVHVKLIDIVLLTQAFRRH